MQAGLEPPLHTKDCLRTTDHTLLFRPRSNNLHLNPLDGFLHLKTSRNLSRAMEVQGSHSRVVDMMIKEVVEDTGKRPSTDHQRVNNKGGSTTDTSNRAVKDKRIVALVVDCELMFQR